MKLTSTFKFQMSTSILEVHSPQDIRRNILMITIICNSNMVKKLVIGVMCESWFTILITSESAEMGMNHTESNHFDDTLKRGDRRRDDADPGDRTSGIITLVW
jgi:hypothetical protein